MTDLQCDLVDRLGAAYSYGTGEGPIHCFRPDVCRITGRSPTVVQSMTDAECQAVFDHFDGQAEARETARREAQQARERAAANERLRQSGRYGILMADDE
ncbi:MAG: hypothetical protein V3S01_00905 [Dehalococcoidia bacterium]